MAGLISGLVKNIHLSSLYHNFESSLNMLGSLNQVRYKRKSYKSANNPQTGVDLHYKKPFQEWWDWDGKGPYKYRHHHYPNNITCRDVQRRRIFKRMHFERSKLGDIRKNDILPSEVQQMAWEKANAMPYDSNIARLNYRCTVTGRARGNYHEFRASRFIFRNEADHARVSGVQRAFWLYNTKINP